MVKKTKKISSRELTKYIEQAILEKKGLNVIKLDLTKIQNAVCDYFIICHGNSNVHIETIANSLIETVNKKSGNKPVHKEGFAKAEWILIDYFNVVVHIFQKKQRDYYKLEDLWADAIIEQVGSENRDAGDV